MEQENEDTTAGHAEHDEQLLESCVQYVLDRVKHVIETFGPRASGSEAERNAQEYARDELSAWVDDVEAEPFRVASKAFMSFVPVTAVLMLVSVALYWVWPEGAFFASGFAVAVVVTEFVLYRRVLDSVFPKTISCNVIGRKRPTGETKRRLLISGHMDSAYEWRYSYRSVALLKVVAISGILGALLVFVTSLLHWALGTDWAAGYQGVWMWVGVAQLVFVPSFVAMLFFTDFSRPVPGANDNLTGTFGTLAVAKYLHEAGLKLENTELRFISMGSEEAGLRGAKEYAARHNEELKKVETAFLGLETFRDLEYLAVYNRDMNGLVKHDPRVCALFKQAGERCGRNLGYESIYVGASDAAAFTQAGIPASTLAGMDPAPPQYYHTRLDHWDNMSPACIREALAITLEVVRRFDAEGMPEV